MIECNMLDAYREQIVSFFFKNNIKVKFTRRRPVRDTQKKKKRNRLESSADYFNIIRLQLN